MPVLLRVLGPAPGVCLALAKAFPEVMHKALALIGSVTTCGQN